MRVQLLTNMGAVVAVSVRLHETATATATATTMLQQLLQHARTQMQLLMGMGGAVLVSARSPLLLAMATKRQQRNSNVNEIGIASECGRRGGYVYSFGSIYYLCRSVGSPGGRLGVGGGGCLVQVLLWWR